MQADFNSVLLEVELAFGVAVTLKNFTASGPYNPATGVRPRTSVNRTVKVVFGQAQSVFSGPGAGGQSFGAVVTLRRDQSGGAVEVKPGDELADAVTVWKVVTVAQECGTAGLRLECTRLDARVS